MRLTRKQKSTATPAATLAELQDRMTGLLAAQSLSDLDMATTNLMAGTNQMLASAR